MQFSTASTVRLSSGVDTVQRVARGDHAEFETLMRKNNCRLFRLARVILKDDAEAEAALQEAYVAAHSTLKIRRADSDLSTWLTRTLVIEALRRRERKNRDSVVIPFVPVKRPPPENKPAAAINGKRTSPEGVTLRAGMKALVEKKLDELPMTFQTVFVMRELEGMTLQDTARCLGLSEATVRSRLSRAKSLFRALLEREVAPVLQDVFAFGADRCERMVEAVLARIANDTHHT